MAGASYLQQIARRAVQPTPGLLPPRRFAHALPDAPTERPTSASWVPAPPAVVPTGERISPRQVGVGDPPRPTDVQPEAEVSREAKVPAAVETPPPDVGRFARRVLPRQAPRAPDEA